MLLDQWTDAILRLSTFSPFCEKADAGTEQKARDRIVGGNRCDMLRTFQERQTVLKPSLATVRLVFFLPAFTPRLHILFYFNTKKEFLHFSLAAEEYSLSRVCCDFNAVPLVTSSLFLLQTSHAAAQTSKCCIIVREHLQDLQTTQGSLFGIDNSLLLHY